jgi:glycerophosphoryl diester phosphodiesterase
MPMKCLQLSLILTIPFILNACCTHKTEIVAHRGASGLETENTIEAVQKAFELNSDAAEIDIWRTIDDSLIVFHDRNTSRLSDDSLVIPESTYEELRKLRLDRNRQIPTLSEVLKILPPDKRLFIEIKCCWEKGDTGNVFPMLSDIVNKTQKRDQVAIISFNPQKLKDAAAYLPDVPRYWLLWQEQSPGEIIKTAQACNVNGIDIHYSLLNEALMREVKKNNLKVYVWTVNSAGEVRNIINKYGGIEGITTDVPDLIMHELKTDVNK